MPDQSKHSPFEDIRQIISAFPSVDDHAVEAVRKRNQQLTKPPGSMGRLEWLAEWLAGWQGKAQPSIDRPLVAVFAGSHGVAERGVSAYPSEVNHQMLANFAAGGAAINQICTAYGLGFKVFDLAIDMPTKDFVEEPAMDEKACVATMAFGMEALAGETDVLAIGELGIGNTTSAAAIFAALYGGKPESWVGRGTGVDDAGFARKVAAVEAGLKRHEALLYDPLEVLRCLGGREIAAMAGAIIAARVQRIPVVIDGYVATAAAAVLHEIDSSALDHCVAGHMSAEGNHRDVLERLNKIPLLALGLHLGEGTGAAMAMGVIKAAVQMHNGMATFDQAGVSGATSEHTH
ncbi:nicotinate-nucleotide--dimethylbenzimidazole phosphoribosyltransferase [Microvirga sp. W0021]|uniref:Nicotinate-nucleotide--dimethylbenzimidazole phosphoribosyltransferase n=1 Tax=Hohaiivirga grylli TaxID=3133970 RepID=A0ABV0BLN1_9HYPH